MNAQVTNPLAGDANASSPPPPVLWAMLTHSNDYWQVGSAIPKSVPLQMVGVSDRASHEDLTVMKLVRLESGDVYAFAFPRVGTELDSIKTGVQFKISSMSVKMTSSFARFDVLKGLIDEAEERAQLEEERIFSEMGDPDTDEPDEDGPAAEVPAPAVVQVAPAQPNTNGGGVPPFMNQIQNPPTS